MNKKTKLNIFDIEIILAHVIKKSREFILTHPEYKLTKLQIKNYELRIKERINGWSIAAITGEKEFYGLKFKVDKNVLIPRPETELLVEEAMKRITHNTQHITIIDVGTGSGCIIVTLAKLAPNFRFIGIDISSKALTIAKQNAKLNGVEKKIKFLKGNLLSPILNSKLKIRHRLGGVPLWRDNSSFLILANLPYLSPAQVKNSPSIQKEPRLALVAGCDGLKYYRQLFAQIKKLRLVLPQSQISLICEIDPSQKTILAKIAKQSFPQKKLIFKRDLSKKTRLTIIN